LSDYEVSLCVNLCNIGAIKIMQINTTGQDIFIAYMYVSKINS